MRTRTTHFTIVADSVERIRNLLLGERGGFLFRRQQHISSLILAAGLSSRMGSFKPMMAFRGKTLIENTINSVLRGGAQSVLVVTGYRGAELEYFLQDRYGSKVYFARNYYFAETDMMHSIQIGLSALPPCDAFFLLPGDMPVVHQSTFEKLLEVRSQSEISIVFPTLGGYRKHPPLVDARLIPEILAFQGSGGMRQLWQQYDELIRTVSVDDEGVWVDLDTQNDYQKCRQLYESIGLGGSN